MFDITGYVSFCGRSNCAYVSAILDGWNVQLHPLDVDQFTAATHNAFVRSMELWQHVPEEHVLIFQTDSLILRGGMERCLLSATPHLPFHFVIGRSV